MQTRRVLRQLAAAPRWVLGLAIIVATILDSACGYAAFSLMAADVAVLTVEYKIKY